MNRNSIMENTFLNLKIIRYEIIDATSRPIRRWEYRYQAVQCPRETPLPLHVAHRAKRPFPRVPATRSSNEGLSPDGRCLYLRIKVRSCRFQPCSVKLHGLLTNQRALRQWQTRREEAHGARKRVCHRANTFQRSARGVPRPRFGTTARRYPSNVGAPRPWSVSVA